MLSAFFRRKNLNRGAHDGVVYLLGRSPQKKGTVQDRMTFKHADHKSQAIEVGQSQDCNRFPYSFKQKLAGLQLEFKSGFIKGVVRNSPKQANCIPDHHPANPGVRMML